MAATSLDGAPALVPAPAASASTAPTVRRRLAPNVICMFLEERLPVINVKRRGRNPRNVVSIWSVPRLKPGDMAELCNGALPSNHGKKVRIIGRAVEQDLPRGDWWYIESVSEPLDMRDINSNLSDGQGMGECIVLAKSLRRVSNRAR